MRNLLISLIIILVLVGGMIKLLGTTTSQPAQSANNVSLLSGQQIIHITAKAGYNPRQTTATANVPTTLRMLTNSTYDCSSILSISSVRDRFTLPPNGTTDIKLAAQPSGSVITGVCGMGMYNFRITFQ